MAIIKSIYTNTNATFSSGTEAQADKNQFFPQSLTDLINQTYSTMVADGIAVSSPVAEWDQTIHQLSMVKEVSSVAAYYGAIAWSLADVDPYSVQAGWTFVEDQVTE